MKTGLKQTKFTEDLGSKNINTQTTADSTKHGHFIREEHKEIRKKQPGEK